MFDTTIFLIIICLNDSSLTDVGQNQNSLTPKDSCHETTWLETLLCGLKSAKTRKKVHKNRTT